MTRDLATLPSTILLAVPETEPERVFSADAHAAKAEFKVLAVRWHPDHNGNDDKVFKHVHALFDQAMTLIEKGGWREPALKIEDEKPNVLVLRAEGDVKKPLKRIRYLKRVPFELGDTYIGNTVVAYVIKNDFADLFENARKIISGFKYADPKMETEFSRYLPTIASVFYTKDRCVMVVKKTPDLFRLADVLEFFKGKIDPKHVAWMQNSILNLVCYLGWANLTHNAISPDTYFISPEFHNGSLLGGWWYAKPNEARLQALPERTTRYCPPDILRDKKADIRTDLELVRTLGRELLGDITGMQLASEHLIPQPIIDWLRHPTSGNPVADYEQWSEKVLPAVFGKRRFVKMDITASDIYKEK